MAKNKAKSMRLDLSNVSDAGGTFRKVRQTAGDYTAKIADVELVDKKGDKKGKQWLWTIKAGSGTYPYYTGFEENVLWKIRNLFAAAGVNLPKKMVSVDPTKIVGKTIGVTLDDAVYDGKEQSEIGATFPASEVDGAIVEDDDDDDDEDEDDDDVEDDDDDDDDDEDDDDEDEEEDDDEDEDDEDDDDSDEDDEDDEEEDEDEDDDEEDEPEPEPEPVKKKKVKKTKVEEKVSKKAKGKKGKKKRTDDVDDDELEELEIEDI